MRLTVQDDGDRLRMPNHSTRGKALVAYVFDVCPVIASGGFPCGYAFANL